MYKLLSPSVCSEIPSSLIHKMLQINAKRMTVLLVANGKSFMHKDVSSRSDYYSSLFLMPCLIQQRSPACSQRCGRNIKNDKVSSRHTTLHWLLIKACLKFSPWLTKSWVAWCHHISLPSSGCGHWAVLCTVAAGYLVISTENMWESCSLWSIRPE